VRGDHGFLRPARQGQRASPGSAPRWPDPAGSTRLRQPAAARFLSLPRQPPRLPFDPFGMLFQPLSSQQAAIAARDCVSMKKGRPEGRPCGSRQGGPASGLRGRRKAIRFARSSGLGRPAKAILVPGITFLGFPGRRTALRASRLRPTWRPWLRNRRSPDRGALRLTTPFRCGPTAFAAVQLVARAAFLEHRLARRRIGRGQQGGDVHRLAGAPSAGAAASPVSIV
jgi:hypothetical protein